MAASVLAVVAVVALITLIVGVLQPVIAIVVFALAFVPLAVILASSAFRHAGGTANTSSGPAVPSTRDASYDPVSDPADRG